ncbi:MAG: PqqD family peptide modification chaperone [Actinomycetota bacterium]
MRERPAASAASPDEIDGAFVPVRRPDVTTVVLEGETVALAEGAADAYYLDQMATLVWGTFDGTATLDELADDFAEAFGADLDVVRDDVVKLTKGIARAGLLMGFAYTRPSKPSVALQTGVGVGEPIPPFTLPDGEGTEVGISDLRGRDVLLVNWSPRCEFCAKLAPGLAELQPALRARGIELVFVALGDAGENRPMLEEHGLRPRLLLAGEDETDVFAGVGTPAAYLMDREGRAASELTVGADTIPGLAQGAVNAT